jgi:signal transduction histidine kinase
LSKVLLQQQAAMQDKQLQLKHIGCNDCSLLRMDSAQMHQVLLNLIKNAIEACPQQGLIEVSLRRDRTELTLQVINDGENLSENTRKQAFEPFFTTKPKGTGLGLGLVKRVVEEHGGQVILENSPDKRVSIILKFPLHSN